MCSVGSADSWVLRTMQKLLRLLGYGLVMPQQGAPPEFVGPLLFWIDQASPGPQVHGIAWRRGRWRWWEKVEREGGCGGWCRVIRRVLELLREVQKKGK